MDNVTFWLLAVTGIGLINTLYLSYHAIRKTSVACLFFPDAWCEKVQHSNYSKTFGIPNPYAGLGMLSVILLLLLLYQNSVIALWPAFAVITIGFVFSVYFLYIQAWVIKAFCTWCVLSFVVFTALFFIGINLIL